MGCPRVRASKAYSRPASLPITTLRPFTRTRCTRSRKGAARDGLREKTRYVVAAKRGAAAGGLAWHFCRAPVVGLDYEMDVRGAWREIVL